MSGEPMTLKVVNKINRKLRFLYRKNNFLTPELHKMLCNALIQPHLGTCTAWYPNLTKKNKKEETNYTRYICVLFCLRLDNAAYISYGV